MKWISVKEALPIPTGNFIIIGYLDDFGNKLHTVGIYTGENFIDEIGKRRYLKMPKHKVTHWMHLPQPETIPSD